MWSVDRDTRDRIDDVFARWNSTETPGMTLGIYRGADLVHSAAYGMANLEHGVSLRPDSIFHVASISKQFTAFSIALLAADGKLDVDDPVRAYIPEVPDFGTPVTLRHLIHHASGIRDQWELLRLSGWREEDLVTDRDVLYLVERQKALNFPPNTAYLYSNTGYTLLSIVVRRVSGKSLRAFAQERIFKPLGMTRTHFHDDHGEIVPGRTQAYEPRPEGGLKISIPEFDVAGTTSLFTTVEDLAKWNGNFTSGAIGGPDLLERVQAPGVFANGDPMTYAWGLATGEWRGVSRVGHAGADHGYRANYQRYPAFDLGIAVLSNVADSAPALLVGQVAEVLLRERLAPPRLSPVSELHRVSPEQMAGTYREESGHGYLTISDHDGSARFDALDEPGELTDLGDGRFAYDPWLTVEVVEVGPDGQPSCVRTIAREDDAETVYQRLPAVVSSAADLLAFAGSYWSDEVETSVRIEVHPYACGLTLSGRKHPEWLLKPLEADRFGIGSDLALRFERDDTGWIRGFRLTTPRIRDLAYVREV